MALLEGFAARKVAAACFLAVLLAGSITTVLCWPLNISPCEIADFTESVKAAIDLVAETLTQIFTLSTTLVGLGAALLLGLKQEAKLTPTTRLLVLSAVTSFSFSAYFCLRWRSGVAEIRFLECPKLVTDRTMANIFAAATNFFTIGLLFLGLVVIVAAFSKTSREETHEVER